MKDNQIFWNPKNIEETHIFQFSKFCFSQGEKDYFKIHKWSIENLSEFWKKFIEYSNIPYEGNLHSVIEQGEHFIKTKFFPNIKINFAECILNPCLNSANNRTVIYSCNENQAIQEISSQDLVRNVLRLQNFFLKNGLQKGDRVAVYLPNIPETIYIMLACTSLGGIFTSCSPDFGKNAVLSRFSQIQPKFFFFADGYFYKSKKISKLQESLEILQELISVEKAVLIPYLDDSSQLPNTINMQEIPDSSNSLIFPKFDFQTPIYIMYSSGTTGLPKCMVQGPGVFMNHHKEHLLHVDLKPNEKIFYFTTCGWMMWNWLISALGTGASIVLYDGNPFHPTSAILWEIAEKLEINVFGTSAGYLAALEKTGYEVKNHYKLSKLRAILSTGSPLLAEQFDFVYNKIHSEIQLASISGGTDLNGCFVIGTPLLPVRRGEIQAPALGMDVDVWDENANSITEQEGELVCKLAFPSMPLYFWNDPNDEKYKNSYFQKYPNIWRHGDYAIRTQNGGFIILGRSDATLNPGGVRIGTADIYKIVESILEVQDSLAIGQKWKGDERIVLFVKLKEGFSFNEDLELKIKLELKSKASPRHVPDVILPVTEIPYTRNMKKVELLVKNLLEKKPITNRDSLHNPHVIEYYQEIIDKYLKHDS